MDLQFSRRVCDGFSRGGGWACGEMRAGETDAMEIIFLRDEGCEVDKVKGEQSE